jgi:hypothetical protein
MYYQEACTTNSYKKRIHPYKGKYQIPYGSSFCVTGVVWDTYVNNPFVLSTRKGFLSTISLICIDEKKETKMTLPYAALENVTTDVGPISTHGQRKIDARHYHGDIFLLLEICTILLQKCRTVF